MTQTGCEDFISRHRDQIRELVKERDVQYRKDKKGRKSRESLDWSWEYVKLKGEGINLGQDYKEHKKYLMNLYENRVTCDCGMP